MNAKGMEKLWWRFMNFKLPEMPIPYSITVSPLGKMTVNVCVWTLCEGQVFMVNRTLGQGTSDANFLMNLNGQLCELYHDCKKQYPDAPAAISCNKV